METQDKDRDPRSDKTEEKPKQPSRHEDPIDEATDESFPASDPPAY